MIQFEKFTATDFEQFINWIENEEMMVQFCGSLFSYPITKAQLEAYLSIENTTIFKIIDATTAVSIGHCEIVTAEENTAKLCRILIGDPKARGKGLGGKIVTALTRYCLEQLQVKTIELNVYDWNIAAIQCYEKAGFAIHPSKSTTTVFKDQTWRSINMVYKKQDKKI